MKSTNKITKDQFMSIINESVNDVLNRIGMINEMAVPLKTYKAMVDALRFQLVENWCLCKWCQIFNPKCKDFAHWVGELKACINNLKFLDIKNGINKRKILIRMLVNDYDYDKTNMIGRIMMGKFDREKITDNNQRANVVSEFVNNIYGIIEVISNDTIDTDLYVQKTFNCE